MLFWIMPDNAERTQNIMEDFLKDFKKENPSIDIEIKVINRATLWNNIFSLRHLIRAGKGPDLIAMPHYWTELLIKADVLVNLTEFDKTFRVDNYLEILHPHCYKKGTSDIYSIPWWFDITALHYREDHLSQITSAPQELLSTWQGMLEACKMLKERFSDVEGYFPMQNSDWRGSLSHRAVLPCIWSKGGFLMDEKENLSGFNIAQTRQGIEDFAQLALKGYMPILRERSSLGTISSGYASMIMTRRQGIAMFEGQKANFEVKTLPIPKTGDNYVNYLDATNLALIKGEHQQEASLLLKWLTLPENQIKYSALTEVFPSLEASFENFLISSPARVQNYTKILSTARTLPSHIASGTLMEMLGEVMTKTSSDIVKNSYSITNLEELLLKEQKEADDILSLYRE
ncbi:MAG: extracellular solute-binding protein [Elusimicrobiaceae bacterium]|nr:extracellular solute-binding protein [Elusimicrobiaceae bacterium]